MNFIVAADLDYGIAKNGNLLARLPKDLQFFKEKTLGNVVIMGRKTLESLPGKKPLPGRTTLILSRSPEYTCENAVVLHSAGEVLTWLKERQIPEEQVFVSGGAEIYRLFMEYCQVGYLTKIYHRFGADRHIENMEQDAHWQEIYRSPRQEENGYAYEWITYRRKE